MRHEAMLAGLHFSTKLHVSTKHASSVEVERGILGLSIRFLSRRIEGPLTVTYGSMFSVVTVLHVGKNEHVSTTPPPSSFFALLGEACQSGAAVYRQRRRCFGV